MRFSILDPGLKTVEGHHFDLDRRLVNALARGGHELTVHGFITPDPVLIARAKATNLNFCANFRACPYSRLSKSQSLAEAYREMAQITAQDLATVPETDAWIWPTMSPYQFAAAAQHPGSVRQIGGVWWLPRIPHAMGARSWSETVRKLAEKPRRIVVGAYDELLCQGYQGYAPGQDIVCLPCPHDGTTYERNATNAPSMRRIGFFGHQRAQRGKDLIPELVDALAVKGYEVVMQDSGCCQKRARQKGRIPAPGRAAFWSCLRGWRAEQKREDMRVTNLNYVEDFPAEIARCDLVIWPSQWEAYTQSLSGVVSECIATGVPIILPSGCLPAQIAARYGCGVLFHEYSSAAILAAVDEAAGNFPGLSARSRAAATAWHSRNGTDLLAAWIERRLGDWT